MPALLYLDGRGVAARLVPRSFCGEESWSAPARPLFAGWQSAVRAGLPDACGSCWRERQSRGPAQQAIGKRCKTPLSVASHSGSEMTITVEIARYTATDAIVEGFALTVRLTAGGMDHRALFEQ
jgi:hypothetical protein